MPNQHKMPQKEPSPHSQLLNTLNTTNKKHPSPKSSMRPTINFLILPHLYNKNLWKTTPTNSVKYTINLFLQISSIKKNKTAKIRKIHLWNKLSPQTM